jgi:hypothetical protein
MMGNTYQYDDFGNPVFKYRQVTATVLKWFADLNARDILVVTNIFGFIVTAEAGDTLTFSDEDGTNVFLALSIASAGAFQYHDLYIPLPMGKDIKVVHSGTSGVINVTVTCARRPYLP